MFFFQWKGVSDRRVERNDWRFLENRWRSWSPGWTPPADDIANLKAAFAQSGVKQAALGYYRAAFNQKAPRYAEGAALFAKPIAAPTLGLCGERDGCIGADVFVKSMLPAMFASEVTIKRIPNAGHFLHLEQPAAVNGAILTFLKDTTAPRP
jgi:pimeloyl-ACP methyl ester carboxylesterase